MPVRTLSRRTMLRGAGAATLGLPFLEAMRPRTAHAGQGSPPLRLLVFFSNNGTYHPAYYPTGTETDFTLGPILEPLTSYRDRLIVTRGIDMEVSYHGFEVGGPHHWIGCLLSGALVQANPQTGWAIGGGQTIDQRIAQEIGDQTRFPSLQMGVQAQQYSGNIQAHLSYAGPGQPMAREDDPQQVFDMLFGDLGADPNDLMARRARRQLVVDAVQDDLGRLRGWLGTEDRLRLDEHIAAVAQLEQQIGQLGGKDATCTAPRFTDPTGGGSVYANDIYPELGTAVMDMLVMALACDLSRVSTLQWNEALGSVTFNWLGHTEDWHDISHKGNSNDVGNQQKIDVNRWYAEQLAYLAGRLGAIPEGDGSLLDNTLIVWVNELSRGNAHDRRDMPLVIMGDAQGYFSTGRNLTYQGAYHNDLLVSVANAMGVDIDTFGEPAYCTGPLVGLTG